MNLNFLKDNSNQLVLFDMDGVLAEYIVGEGALIINEVPGGGLFKQKAVKINNFNSPNVIPKK